MSGGSKFSSGLRFVSCGDFELRVAVGDFGYRQRWLQINLEEWGQAFDSAILVQS